jgi:hypothetical protein
MSHVADVDLEIKDLDSLAKAADDLGFELVRGKKNFKWYGRFMNDWNNAERAAALKGFDPSKFGECDHVLRIKGAPEGQYEIGLVKHPSGKAGWVPLYDAYGVGRNLETKCGGVGLPKLKQEYSKQVSQKTVKRMGYRVNIFTLPDGRIQVRGKK